MQTALMTAMLLAILFCIPVGSQELTSLIETSIRNKEPQWLLASKEPEGESTIYRWRSGEERVTLQIYQLGSEAAASKGLQKYAQQFNMPPKERPKNLGDEAYLWADPLGGGGILFRKSNSFAYINGSSILNVRRFALHVLDLIPSK